MFKSLTSDHPESPKKTEKLYPKKTEKHRFS